MQGSTQTQPRHQEEIGRLGLNSAAFTPWEKPRYSFYRRLSVPEDYSEHEGVKKNLHPFDTEDRTRTLQPIAKRLVASATWPTPLYRVGLNRVFLKELCTPLYYLRLTLKWYGGVFHLKQLEILTLFGVFWTKVRASKQ